MPYIPTNQKPPSIRKPLILRATLCFLLSPAIVIAAMAIDDAPNGFLNLQNAWEPVVILSLPGLVLGWLIAAAFPKTITRRPWLCCGIFTFFGMIYAGLIELYFSRSHMLCLIAVSSVLVAGLAMAAWLHAFPIGKKPQPEPTLEPLAL